MKRPRRLTETDASTFSADRAASFVDVPVAAPSCNDRPPARDRPAVPLRLRPLVRAVADASTSERATVVDALATVVAREGVDLEGLTSVLGCVAALAPHPGGLERQALARLADALGRRRLLAALDEPGASRLGAARLLLAGGDPS